MLVGKRTPELIEVLAKRIIAIGKTGERSPDKICGLALGVFSIQSAGT